MFLVVILVFMSYQPIIEHLLIYDVNLDDTQITINWEPYDNSRIAIQELKQIPFVVFNKNDPNALQVTDIFTYKQRNTNFEIYKVFNDQKTLLLMKKRDAYTNEQLINTHKTIIGCPTDIHQQLFKLLCKAMKIDPEQFSIVNTTDLNQVDILVFYESLNNQRKQESHLIDFVGYDDLNTDNIKYFIPYCQIINRSLNIYFIEYNDRFPVKKVLNLDIILCGKPNSNFRKVKDPKYNFLNMFIEQFTQESIIVRPQINTNGVLWDNKFYLDKPEIEGIPLIPNMIVHITKQSNMKENGHYTVSDNPKILVRNNKPRLLPQCIDHPDVHANETCPTFWDKPCEFDSECPFFSPHNIGVGGCIDSVCQMPVGVTPKGYTKYDDTPFDGSVFPLR